MLDMNEGFTYDAEIHSYQTEVTATAQWYYEQYSRPVFSHGYKNKQAIRIVVEHIANDIQCSKTRQLPLQKLLLDLFLRYKLTKGVGTIGVFTSCGKLTAKGSPQYKTFKVTGNIVRELVFALKDQGYIEHKAGQPRHSTKLRATDKLIDLMEGSGSTLNDYSCRRIWPVCYTEIIKGEDESALITKAKHRIDRAQAERLGLKKLILFNSLAIKSDIRVGTLPLLSYEKQLRRTFTDASGEFNGRMCGPIWQNLSSDARPFLTINGEGTTEYDICSTHPLIAYALNGHDLTSLIPYEGKPYELHTIDTSIRVNRRIVKQALLTMFNAADENKAFQGLRSFVNTKVDSITGELIYRTAWQRICDEQGLSETEGYYWLFKQLEHKHHRISDFFYSEGWKRLNRLESEICLEVIAYFAEDHQTIVLPVHDSFICPMSVSESLPEAIRAAISCALKIEFQNPKLLVSEKAAPDHMNSQQAMDRLTQARTIRQDFKDRYRLT